MGTELVDHRYTFSEHKGNVWLFLLLMLTFVRGIGYVVVIPPWQAPDETGHFEYAWLIANSGKFPEPETSAAFEQELLGSLYEWQYGEFIQRPLPDRMPLRLDDLPRNVFAARSRTISDPRFSLSYVWQALFLYPFRHQDLAFQLYVARISSVLLNIGIIWVAWHIFRLLLPRRPLLITAMTAALVFWPQHTFINSMVGEGALAEFMVVIVLYSWVRLFGAQNVYLSVLGIVFGTFLGIWTKTTAAFLIPVNFGLFVWWARKNVIRRWNQLYWLYAFLFLIVLGLGGWLWSRSALGANVLTKAQMLFDGSSVAWIDIRGMTLGEALLSTHDSLWANFGWMSIAVSERWYGAILFVTVLGLIGWFWTWNRGGARDWHGVLMTSFWAIAWVVFIWVALLSKGESGYYQYQGRYLFPIAVPHIFLVLKGLDRLFLTSSKPWVFRLLLLSLIGFDVWCSVGYIWIYYYGG